MRANLTTEEFFTIVAEKRDDLKRISLKYLRSKLDVVLDDDTIEDCLNEVILTTAEKLARPDCKTVISNWNDVRNYLVKSFWYCYKNAGLKKQKDQHSNRYVPINTIHNHTIGDTEQTEDPIINNTSEVYNRIFQYVYSKYPHEEAATYKAHTINSFTIDQLAEATKFNRSRCYAIIKKIRADVRANKEYFLKGFANSKEA